MRRALARYVVSRTEIDETVRAPIDGILGRLTTTETDLDQRFARMEPIVEDLVAAVRGLRSRTEATMLVGRRQRELEAELRTVPYMSGDPFERFSAPVGEVVGFRAALRDADSLYAGFEDVFRGPAERVIETQRPYLPLVRGHAPVLDVGCGRGEFLTLLAREGIAASGVDADAGMVQRCRAAGLAVEHGDAISHLEAATPGSLGAVFCAQVIEHLPVEALQRLLAGAREALCPGGIFIAETVNPHSLPALKTFWVDLTHQHPIFPEVALAFCGLAGFDSAYVFAPGFPDFAEARFASNSYAVVAAVEGEIDGD